MKLFGISRNAMVAGMVGAGAMGVFLLGPQFPNADANPITLEAPNGAPMSFADLIEQVSPAVVGVRVRTEIQLSDRELTDRERFLEQFGEQFGLIPREEAPRPREGFGQGSGFFISAEGHIVTNNHVVDNAVEIEVTTDDGSVLEAEIVGVDAETDLAVLKVISPGPHPFCRVSVRPRNCAGVTGSSLWEARLDLRAPRPRASSLPWVSLAICAARNLIPTICRSMPQSIAAIQAVPPSI